MAFVSILVLALIVVAYIVTQLNLWRACKIQKPDVALTTASANEVLFETETILTVEYHRYLNEGNRGFKPIYHPRADGAIQPSDFPFGPEFP